MKNWNKGGWISDIVHEDMNPIERIVHHIVGVLLKWGFLNHKVKVALGQEFIVFTIYMLDLRA